MWILWGWGVLRNRINTNYINALPCCCDELLRTGGVVFRNTSDALYIRGNIKLHSALNILYIFEIMVGVLNTITDYKYVDTSNNGGEGCQRK